MKTFLQLSRVIFALLLLTGCGMRGLLWNEARIGGDAVPGALNVGNLRPLIQSSCGTTAFLAHGPTCAYAFIDSSGKRVNIFNLRDELDSLAEKIPAMRPWINKPKDRKDSSLFPYSLHLLTVSPAVVLVVPRERKEWNSDCGFVLKTGCIQSQSFSGNSYLFFAQPRIRSGSFWFTPELPGEIFPIDSLTNETTIKVGESVIKLIPANDTWNIQREK